MTSTLPTLNANNSEEENARNDNEMAAQTTHETTTNVHEKNETTSQHFEEQLNKILQSLDSFEVAVARQEIPIRTETPVSSSESFSAPSTNEETRNERTRSFANLIRNIPIVHLTIEDRQLKIPYLAGKTKFNGKSTFLQQNSCKI